MKKLLLASLFLTIAAAAAEFPATFGIKSFGNSKLLKATGENSFKTEKWNWFIGTRRFVPDPAKTYTVTAEVRAAESTGKKSFSIGFFGIAANGSIITIPNVYALGGTGTTLTAAADPGDKVLKIADGAKWRKGGFLAWDVDLSEKQRDLPNFNVVPIKQVRRNGDGWEVELTSPFKKKVSAGTPVRQHLNGWSFLTSDPVKPTGEWQKVSWQVKPGEAVTNTRGKWLRGTKKFVILFTSSAGVEVRNIQLTEEPAK